MNAATPWNRTISALWALEFGTERIRTATQLVQDAQTEPLQTADAKLHCRIDSSDEDPLVAKWIKAARRKVERDTGRALVTQTWDLFLDAFPSGRQPIEVPYPPLQSVTSVNSTDTNGLETTVATSNYVVDTASEPGRIGLTDSGSWPTDLRGFQPGRIRFIAGAAVADVPEDLVRALALVVGWQYRNREPEKFEQAAYDALIAPYVLPVIA